MGIKLKKGFGSSNREVEDRSKRGLGLLLWVSGVANRPDTHHIHTRISASFGFRRIQTWPKPVLSDQVRLIKWNFLVLQLLDRSSWIGFLPIFRS